MSVFFSRVFRAGLGLLFVAPTMLHAESHIHKQALSDAPVPPELADVDIAGAATERSRTTSGDPADARVGMTPLVRRAVNENPNIKESLTIIRGQQQNVAVEEAGYLPQISARTRSEYNSNLDRYVDVAGLTASQLLWDFGATSNAVKREEATLTRRQAQALGRIESLSADVSTTFVDIQHQQALRSVAEDQLERLAELRDITVRRARRGASAQAEAGQAEARVEAARITLSRINTNLNRAHQELRRFIPGIEIDGVANEVPESVSQACESTRVENGAQLPETLAAEANREATRAQLEVDRASRWPRVSLDVRADRYLESDIPEQNQFGVYLNASVDLFRGGANRAKVSGSRYREQAASYAVEAAMLDARERLAMARVQSRDLKRQLKSLRMRIGHLDEVRGRYRMQYIRAGTRTLLDVLNTEQEYYRARFDLIDARFQYRQIQVDCLEAGGSMRSAFDIATGMVELAGDGQ